MKNIATNQKLILLMLITAFLMCWVQGVSHGGSVVGGVGEALGAAGTAVVTAVGAGLGAAGTVVGVAAGAVSNCCWCPWPQRPPHCHCCLAYR